MREFLLFLFVCTTALAAPTTQPKLTIKGRDIHPIVYLNKDDLALARQNRQTVWGKPIADTLLKEADTWAAKSDEDLIKLIPAPGACFAYGFSGCPICGQTMGTWGSTGCMLEDPGHITCPKGHRLPDEQHPDPGTGWRDKTGKIFYFVGAYNSFISETLLQATSDLVHAYALTGEEKYANKAALLLDHLARIYPSCNKGSWDYPSDPPSGRFNRPWYQVARTLISYTNQYDILMSTKLLTEPSCVPALTRRQNIEQNLLLNGADYCYQESKKHPALHNGQCDYIRGVAVVGAAMGIPKYIQHAVAGSTSINAMLANNIDRDGQYYETSSLYAHHTRYLYMDFAEILHNYYDEEHSFGIHLIDDPRFRAFFTLPQSRITVNGHLAALGDDSPDTKTTTQPASPISDADPAYLEHLLALSQNKTDFQKQLIMLLRAASNYDITESRLHAPAHEKLFLLFHARDLSGGTGDSPVIAQPTIQPSPLIHPLTSAPLTSSDLLTQKGLAILRSDNAQNPAALTFRFGPTLNHGHFDEMNLNLYALGRQLTYDLGYGLGSTHTQVGWSKQTSSHNTVLVNENPQLQAPGAGGSLELSANLPGLKLVQGDDPNCYSSENVTRYARTVALIDLPGADAGRSYIVDIFRITGGTQHDYIFHAASDNISVDGVALSPPAKGSLAGPTIDPGNHQSPDGDIQGIPNKPYWNPPPGNGLGFLINPRSSGREPSGSAAGPRTVTATWHIAKDAHLALTLLPTAQTQFVTATAPGIVPKQPKAAYFLARRNNTNLSSTFAAIQEPYTKQSIIQDICSLTEPLQTATDPVAVKISLTHNRTDYLIHSADTTTHTFTDGDTTLSTDATFSRVSFDKQILSTATIINGTRLSINGTTITLPQAAYSGKLEEVDYVNNVLYTREKLPERDLLTNQFILINNPGYSRPTPYRIDNIKRITRNGAELTAIRLAPTTLVLARAHMNKPPDQLPATQPGDLLLSRKQDQTLRNIIPLEYAKSLTHKSTGFFRGKKITGPGAEGLIYDIDGATGTTIKVEAYPQFTAPGPLIIYDVKATDTFTIPCFAQLTRKPDGTFKCQANIAVTVTENGKTFTLNLIAIPQPLPATTQTTPQ
jgi:hypothetical protein